jgi:tellurite resistance protein TehA-like permease
MTTYLTNSPTLLFFKTRLSDMHPSYFAMSMATGIVAIAGHLLGLKELAITLTWINIITFPILWILLIARIILYPKNVIADFFNHERAPGFFTIVVSTSVLGTQLDLIYNWVAVATILWWANLILWIICTYYIFTALTLQSKKPSLGEGINGGWLIAIVATQSICILGCSLGATVLGDRDLTLLTLMSFWFIGIMLYLWTTVLIFYRYMFFPISPRDLMPPYWINMGAAAITALAGALIANAVKTSMLFNHFHSFILGLSIMFWATATWWIPLLLTLGIWKHYTRHVPINYDPLYWGLVFPFGMYARCTFQLTHALGIPSLLWISKVSVVAAACAWFITFLGFSGRLINTPLFVRQNQSKDPIL